MDEFVGTICPMCNTPILREEDAIFLKNPRRILCNNCYDQVESEAKLIIDLFLEMRNSNDNQS